MVWSARARRRIAGRDIRPNVVLEFANNRSALGNFGPPIRIGPGLEAFKRLLRKQEILEKGSKPAIAQRKNGDGLAVAGKRLENQVPEARTGGVPGQGGQPAARTADSSRIRRTRRACPGTPCRQPCSYRSAVRCRPRRRPSAGVWPIFESCFPVPPSVDNMAVAVERFRTTRG